MRSFEVNKVTKIMHPLVADMYIKTEFSTSRHSTHSEVLVIETNFPIEKTEERSFKSYLNDFLSDLPELTQAVEQQNGHFDRVDIRYTH